MPKVYEKFPSTFRRLELVEYLLGRAPRLVVHKSLDRAFQAYRLEKLRSRAVRFVAFDLRVIPFQKLVMSEDRQIVCGHVLARYLLSAARVAIAEGEVDGMGSWGADTVENAAAVFSVLQERIYCSRNPS